LTSLYSLSVFCSNKLDYIQRIVNFRLTESVQEQSDALIAGVHSIIPLSLLQIYDAGELELLISGLPTIDIDELKNSVQYHGWRNSDPEITWLWRALRSFSQAERAAFMQFVTSSARVPLGGFSQLVGSNGESKASFEPPSFDPIYLFRSKLIVVLTTLQVFNPSRSIELMGNPTESRRVIPGTALLFPRDF
jgi:hypothetical protein